MSKYIIKGGNVLSGTIKVDSCKNAILPIIAASILNKNKVIIKNCPQYTDILKLCEILKKLGGKFYFTKNNLVIDNSNIKYQFIDSSLTKDIRASIFTLGPMLARFKKAKIAYPGGCAIGQRGINIHVNAFRELGVEILEQHGYLYCKCKRIISKDIKLEFPSVGATENLMMFMCACGGNFKILNPAKEPEIVDLANFLNKMGANITGAGTDCISISGQRNFTETIYSPMPDRIIAGTLLIAVAVAGGEVKIKNFCYKHNKILLNTIEKTGCEIIKVRNSIIVKSKGNLNSFGKIETMPFPGFPTDLQSQLSVMGCVCNGVSVIKENIFECRFRYVPELIKMGAKIDVVNNIAIIEGVNNLLGAEVFATDLRGGVALVLAGLKANGYTTVNNVEYIDRGYYKLENQLNKLGANIERVEN